MTNQQSRYIRELDIGKIRETIASEGETWDVDAGITYNLHNLICRYFKERIKNGIRLFDQDGETPVSGPELQSVPILQYYASRKNPQGIEIKLTYQFELGDFPHVEIDYAYRALNVKWGSTKLELSGPLESQVGVDFWLSEAERAIRSKDNDFVEYNGSPEADSYFSEENKIKPSERNEKT